MLLVPTPQGLYCAAGDFHVDPWRPVPRAVITHAHGDHFAHGCGAYLTSASGAPLLRHRLGGEPPIEAVPYGEARTMGGVRLSLHPAGHILGSAQVRLEVGGEVWVASGDYKTVPDRTATPFEPVRCDTFITESTFGLPVYRWPAPGLEEAALADWWRANADAGVTSVVFAYALGKAQRLVAALDAAIGPILVHGAVGPLNDLYRAGGIPLPPTPHASREAVRAARGRALVVAPPSAAGSPWLRGLGETATAVASGWMRIRGTRRRRGVERGFVLSDHADWDGLQSAIRATGATRVLVTHGYTAAMVRWLSEQGLEARALETRFRGDDGDDAAPEGV